MVGQGWVGRVVEGRKKQIRPERNESIYRRGGGWQSTRSESETAVLHE